MTPLAWFLAGLCAGILLERWLGRRRAARRERGLPEPDTIAYRNARSVAEWERRRREIGA